MKYRKINPPEILKPFVRYLWVLEDNTLDTTAKTFNALADGCPGIMFHHSEKGALHDENKELLPGIFLYGQTVDPFKMSSAGQFSTIGICFYPDALKSVFGLNAHELTNSCVDMGLLHNKSTRELNEQLVNTATIEEQLKLLTSHFLTYIQKNDTAKSEITRYALSQILDSKGSLSLKELQQKLQLSERSFERRFKEAVGLSPKLFSRVCQFQEAFSQLRNKDYSKLSDIAYENGYADQSHFIRSFKEFAGFSPNEFKKNADEIGENLTVLKGEQP